MEPERSCFLETENASNRVVGQIWNGDWDKVIISCISITQTSRRKLRRTKSEHGFTWPSVEMCVTFSTDGATSAWAEHATFRGNPRGLAGRDRAMSVPLSPSRHSLGACLHRHAAIRPVASLTGVAAIALSGHKSLEICFLDSVVIYYSITVLLNLN